MKIYQITLPYACFGIQVNNGVIKKTAPIGKWMIGKDIKSKNIAIVARTVYKLGPDDKNYVGLGYTETDRDHWDEYWEDYYCPEPNEIEKNAIIYVGKLLKLPEPRIHKFTWRDG